MPSLVKANASLAAGGLAVLRREYSTSEDGELNYSVDYVCLAAFASNHAGKFRTKSIPPTAIPASMSALRIDGTPTLYDFSTRTENGLTYFSARYSAASLDAGEVITTTTEEQRNFSAEVTGTIVTPSNTGGQSNVTGPVTISFDYMSTTVRVEAKNPRVLPDVKGKVSSPFNISASLLNGERAFFRNQYRATTVESESTTKSSRGTYTYSKSSSGIYEASVSLSA